MQAGMQPTKQGHETPSLAGSSGESLARQTNESGIRTVTTSESTFDDAAVADFRAFLNKHKDSLPTGMGAFHTDNHSNW